MVAPVIVCEPENLALKKLAATLTAGGFPCVGRTSADGVLESLRETPSVTIVMTLGRPGLDGLELVASLRRIEPELAPRRLHLIGIAPDRVLAERFIDGGGDAVFIEPFNSQKLVASVQKAQHRAAAGTAAAGRGAGIPFEASHLLATTPPAPGVIILRDSQRRALLIEWAALIRSRLQVFLVPEDAATRAVSDLTASVDFIVTDDATVAGAVFDHEVTILDDFPRFTPQPPPGSCHTSSNPDSIIATDDSISLDRPLDAAELDRAREALAADPENPAARDWFAFLCYRFGHHDEAVETFAGLIDEGSEAPEHFYYLGCALSAMGNSELAVEMWTRVVLTEPESRLGRKCQRRIEEASAALA